jgi:hypothetical protein
MIQLNGFPDPESLLKQGKKVAFPKAPIGSNKKQA